MRASLATFVGAIGALVAGWALPLLVNDAPLWMRIALFAAGLVLLVVGALLARDRKKKSVEGINVKMGNSNRVGQIGNRYER